MKKSMKNIKFFNRIIASVLMLALIIPFFNVLGVFDAAKSEVEVLASDVTQGTEGTGTPGENGSGEQTGENPTEVNNEDDKKENYVFSFIPEDAHSVYKYDTGTYGKDFTLDGEGYEGVYRNDFKSAENQQLKISDLGEYKLDSSTGQVLSNPYVVLEISPSEAISEIRPHVGGQGFFEMTDEEYASIALTSDEEQTVKIQALQYLFEEHAEEIKKKNAELLQTNITELKNEMKSIQEERKEYILKIENSQFKTAFLTVENNLFQSKYNAYRWVNGVYTYLVLENEYGNSYQYDLANIISNGRVYEYFDNNLSGTNKLKGDIHELYDKLGSEFENGNCSLQTVQEKFVLLLEYQEKLEKGEVPKVIDALNADINNPDNAINNLKSYLIPAVVSEQYFENFVNARLASALEYKKKYLLSERNAKTWNVSNYKYDFDFERFYAVDEETGNLKIYQDAGEKTEVKISGDITTNNVSGEYVTTVQEAYNPLAKKSDAVKGTWTINNATARKQGAIIVHNYTFQKSCLDLGYESQMNETNTKILSQTPYIDEYVFAGWYVNLQRDDGTMELVSIDEKDANGNYLVTDKVLSATTELYTAWSYRYFEEEDYRFMPASAEKNQTVSVKFKSYDGVSKCYTVHLPSCIASANRANHNPKNQLTICTAERNNLVFWDGSKYKADKTYSYVQETSAWDFDFSKSKYKTREQLRNIALKLMPDTDYYVMTYNVVPDLSGNNDGKVTYYPYNILVITITPTELNKMVYYDYEESGYDPEIYRTSSYVNEFLNNVDFIFFSQGGSSQCFTNGSDNYFISVPIDGSDLYGNQTQAVKIEPVPERAPKLYVYNKEKNEIEYDKNQIVDKIEYADKLTEIPDLEWQVVEKIYSRSSDAEQLRKIAIIVSERLGDRISTLAGTSAQITDADDKYISGSNYNLTKLLLMYFSFKNPTDFYQYYINPTYQMEGYDTFDKVKGVLREEAPVSGSYFTGALYDYEYWNTALFFPWELIKEYTGYTHKEMLSQVGNSMFENLEPHSGQLDNLGKNLFESLGLARGSSFKNIANPYAFTFNGDTSIADTFFVYNRPYTDNVTNYYSDYSTGNSHLAFEYFESVGRGDDKPYGEIRDGQISTKSAIEFMIQRAQLATDTELRRSITILNKLDPQAKFVYDNTLIRVDRVVMDDISQPDVDVEFVFNGYEESYYVVEYLWTNRYRNLDNENAMGAFWYTWYTSTVRNDNDRWYKMPDASGVAEKNSFFITRLIDAENNYVENPSSYINHINMGTSYTFNALVKPNVKLANGTNAPGTNNPTYIVVVKQYAKDDLEMKKLKSATIKNVCLEKMSYLFNLD